MLLLGPFLLAATAAFTGLLIAGNLSGGPDYTVTVLDQNIVTMNSLAVFCSGLALALLFCLGLSTAVTATARRRRGHARTHETHSDETRRLDSPS